MNVLLNMQQIIKKNGEEKDVQQLNSTCRKTPEAKNRAWNKVRWRFNERVCDEECKRRELNMRRIL